MNKYKKTLLRTLTIMTDEAEAKMMKERAAMLPNDQMRKRRWRLWTIEERIKNTIRDRSRNGPPGHLEQLRRRTKNTLAYIKKRRQRMK